MLKCINADHQRKHGGEITAVGINVNGKWTWKDKNQKWKQELWRITESGFY